ncbi:hypothetical protein PVAG01_05335 [Phlyctema vagabunda]|uniref:Uncharacterized protein n=1 Tax=Phlyctema vagabunda TaxID=108571 RepID=A0ABR4PJT0_9HELO
MRVGDQTLEFLTFTPDHADSRSQESRRLVRSHAIRDAIRRRRVQAAPGYKQAPVKRAAEVSKPLSEHTGRFRLNTAAKPSRKKNGTKKQDARKKEEVDEEPIVVKLQQDDSSTESLALDSVWDQGRSSISDFAGGALDPFEILPVKYGRRHKALHLYNDAVYRTNSFAFYPNQLFVSYAATDSAWLSATLSLITLYYDLRAGGEVSQECLFHRGEALRIVNERLSTSPEEISDGTIGAVAVLAHFDTTNGSHRSAATHFKGLVQMVSSRGGLLALEQNNLLQKTVGWYVMRPSGVPDF